MCMLTLNAIDDVRSDENDKPLGGTATEHRIPGKHKYCNKRAVLPCRRSQQMLKVEKVAGEALDTIEQTC